jgi:ADP-ribose pyrophosphatase YjhB (NUDIX family)
MATIGAFALLLDDDGSVLCVRQNYPPHEWTLPGGRVEPNESPLAALHREILEETSCRIAIERYVGTYARTDADDLVLLFVARILERATWAPNGEIADLGFFPTASLPHPMNPRHRQRIEDAINGRSGLVRVYDSPDRLLESFLP